MSRTAKVADPIVASNIAPDTLPNQPGEWIITARAPDLRSFTFGCPLRPGQSCHVLLKPHYREAHNSKLHTWTWDGNTLKPTLSPSINCIKDEPRSYGCGWHGFVRGGEFTPP